MTILKKNIPVGLASDHAGYELKEYVKQLLTGKNFMILELIRQKVSIIRILPIL